VKAKPAAKPGKPRKGKGGKGKGKGGKDKKGKGQFDKDGKYTGEKLVVGPYTIYPPSGDIEPCSTLEITVECKPLECGCMNEVIYIYIFVLILNKNIRNLNIKNGF